MRTTREEVRDFLASVQEPPLGSPETGPAMRDSDDITRGQRRNKLLSLPDIQPVAICCVLATLSEQYALFYSPSDVVVAASELVEVGVAAGPPGGAVVGVAPFGWGVAAGFDAALVAVTDAWREDSRA